MITRLKNILSRTEGTQVTRDTIRVRQKGGRVEIPRADIYAVKFQTASRVVVRLRHGARIVLHLFGFGRPSLTEFTTA